MQRDGLNVVLCGGRLCQQYVFDACAKMEQQLLNYLRFNQNSSAVTFTGRSLRKFMHIVCNERNLT